jgi:hypothetical protein
MTELSLEDRNAIEALIIEHAWLLDHGCRGDLAHLYTEDGQLLGSKFGTIKRAQMMTWSNTPPENQTHWSHHQCTNIRIKAEGSDIARGWVQLLLHVREGKGPITEEFVGEYQDRYVRDAQGHWRFSERKLVPLGIAAVDNR